MHTSTPPNLVPRVFPLVIWNGRERPWERVRNFTEHFRLLNKPIKSVLTVGEMSVVNWTLIILWTYSLKRGFQPERMGIRLRWTVWRNRLLTWRLIFIKGDFAFGCVLFACLFTLGSAVIALRRVPLIADWLCYFIFLSFLTKLITGYFDLWSYFIWW